MPPGVELNYWADDSERVKQRLSTLAGSALFGYLLVLLVLSIFLRPVLAFWVSLGIPVAFSGSFIILYLWDVSLNLSTLFAFILVLGIVVDDAIVVGENIYTKRETIKDGVVAAIKGAKGVSVPVTFGVLTTMVAFAPMLNIPGNFREVWKHIALIVIFCLFFSLVESKLVLPAHLAYMSSADKKPRWFLTRGWARLHGGKSLDRGGYGDGVPMSGMD